MRSRWLPALAVLAACDAAPTHAGRLDRLRFHSPALGVDKAVLVYLPRAAPGARLPVIYLLHGLGGDERDGITDARVLRVADALALPAILVMPDGDAGFWVNGAAPVDHDACLRRRPPFGRVDTPAGYCVRAPRYEDYLVRELVPHIDRTYPTVADRRARALSGMSMGGYGALVLAMRNPDVFGSAASHAGMAELRPEAGPIGAHLDAVFGDDPAHRAAHDPVTLAGSLADGRVALYFDCGDADRLGYHERAARLHAALDARGVGHTFVLVPGGRHDEAFFADRVDDGLRFHLDAFRAAGVLGGP